MRHGTSKLPFGKLAGALAAYRRPAAETTCRRSIRPATISLFVIPRGRRRRWQVIRRHAGPVMAHHAAPSSRPPRFLCRDHWTSADPDAATDCRAPPAAVVVSPYQRCRSDARAGEPRGADRRRSHPGRQRRPRRGQLSGAPIAVSIGSLCRAAWGNLPIRRQATLKTIWWPISAGRELSPARRPSARQRASPSVSDKATTFILPAARVGSPSARRSRV